jgi:hypothetical protein
VICKSILLLPLVPLVLVVPVFRHLNPLHFLLKRIGRRMWEGALLLDVLYRTQTVGSVDDPCRLFEGRAGTDVRGFSGFTGLTRASLPPMAESP